ncbi:PLAT domain-containing protein 2-like [Mercurialis annua]|uniref:PLAT domain-containing protein 2-like n=1 Tax=Mercurialis annua TaxID=3986 RepID=UPI00215FA199|nr:PLAT domain-containing protein 2-like [Mercurialis annua]
MAAVFYILSFLLILSLSGVVVSESCDYSIYIKTGSRDNAGTDAKISLKFSNREDLTINIRNLEEYGAMGAGYNYFEQGQLDIFTYSGPCSAIQVCYMELSHDNSGNKPGWYVNYVEITSSGDPLVSSTTHFDVEQWLALDETPHQLSTSRDLCANTYVYGV